MNPKEERKRDAEISGGHIKELIDKKYVVNMNYKKDYVFISYSSLDWKKVLYEIVYDTCKKYGLRVYFDAQFDVGSDSWLTQFKKNMYDKHCKAVLAFVSPNYKSSYATLMELMASQNSDSGKKLVLPIIIGDAVVDSYDNTGLGTYRFSDNSTNDLWQKELLLFNELFNDIVYDPQNQIIPDKDYATKTLYKKSNVSNPIPYKEALDYNALKENHAYWDNVGVYDEEGKEKHWRSMGDKGSSGDLYLTKAKNARLAGIMLGNLDKNNIDGVNKNIPDAINSKLEDLNCQSVFDKNLVENLLISENISNTENAVRSVINDDLCSDKKQDKIYDSTDTALDSHKAPESKEDKELPSGKVGHITVRTGAYDAYYRMNDDGTFTILKGSKVNRNDFTPPSVLKENKNKIGSDGTLNDDITIDTKSTAERFIKGYKNASGQSLIDNLIDDGGITANDKKEEVQFLEQADHVVVEPTTDVDSEGLYKYCLEDVLKKYSTQTFKASDVSTIGLQIQGRPEYSIGQCKNVNELLRAVVNICLDKQGEAYIKQVNRLNKGQKNPVFVKYSKKNNYDAQYSRLEKYPDWAMNMNHDPYNGLRKVGVRIKEQGISLSDVTIIMGNELKEVSSEASNRPVNIFNPSTDELLLNGTRSLNDNVINECDTPDAEVLRAVAEKELRKRGFILRSVGRGINNITYLSADRKKGARIYVSTHETKDGGYWFSPTTSAYDALEEYEEGYFLFVCGVIEKSFLLNARMVREIHRDSNQLKGGKNSILIHEYKGEFIFDNGFNITRYKI